MQIGQRFRFNRHVIAVAAQGQKANSFVVPEGAVVELIADPFKYRSLVFVQYGTETVIMLRDDVKKHAHLIDKPFSRSAVS